MFTNEQWRPVPGFDGYYSVSNMGRFRSEDRTVLDRKGVYRYCPGKLLRVDDTSKDPLRHRVVVSFFKERKRRICNAPKLIKDVWGISMSHDMVLLVNADVIPKGVPVIANETAMFPSFCNAAAYFGSNEPRVRHAVLEGRPVRLQSGIEVKFRLLTDEEKEEYKEFLMNREAIV